VPDAGLQAELTVMASVGFAISPDDGEDAPALVAAEAQPP
jgi:hypothetical protein